MRSVTLFQLYMTFPQMSRWPPGWYTTVESGFLLWRRQSLHSSQPSPLSSPVERDWSVRALSERRDTRFIPDIPAGNRRWLCGEAIRAQCRLYMPYRLRVSHERNKIGMVVV